MPPSERVALIALFVVFAVLCVVFNSVTPYRTGATYAGVTLPDIGAPDERAHVEYVRHLWRRLEFPTFQVPANENYEAHQPPLYYLAAAPLSATGLRASEQVEGILLRLLSTAIGVATLVCIYSAASLLLPSGAMALGATAFAGLLPMQIALFSSVNNDALTQFWFALATCWMLRNLNDGWNGARTAQLASVIGLALLTKTTSLVLIPLALIAVWMSRNRSSSHVTYHVGALVLVPIVIAAPWFVRNSILYGDPLALGAFQQAFAGTATRQGIQEAFGLSALQYYTDWIGWYTFRSFWGAFGYLVVQWPLWLANEVYLALGILTVLGIVGWLRWAIEARVVVGRSLGLLSAQLLLTTAVFVQFTLTFAQGQGRYFAPAMPTIAIFAVGGLTRLVPQKYRDGASHAIIAGMLALACYAVFVAWSGYRIILGR